MPGGEGDRLFVAMPAFAPDGSAAVKLFTYVPDNAKNNRPTIHAVVIVFSESGEPQVVLDGTSVTRLRTGAASALASRYLSREDSHSLVVIGTGALAPEMAIAHCAVRPIRTVTFVGRDEERARALAKATAVRLRGDISVHGTTSAEAAVQGADIVTCATTSATPVLKGAWLKPGTFVDLVGSFSPAKREADDDVVRNARIFVDTFEGALTEAGDLLDPLERGVIARDRIEGELADLVKDRVQGRRIREEVTLFKSVGTALEDLAAARLILDSSAGS
jgi:ornithine cyclodeaminase